MTTWTIVEMDCHSELNGNSKVVRTVQWMCENEDTRRSIVGVCEIPFSENAFTSYGDLIQEQVLGWIWANGVDKEATELAVQQQINNEINSPVVTPPLPWAQGA